MINLNCEFMFQIIELAKEIEKLPEGPTTSLIRELYRFFLCQLIAYHTD